MDERDALGLMVVLGWRGLQLRCRRSPHSSLPTPASPTPSATCPCLPLWQPWTLYHNATVVTNDQVYPTNIKLLEDWVEWTQ